MKNPMKRPLLRTLIALLLATASLSTVHAEIHFTDIAGRAITLQQPAKKIILGEGRFLAILGVLGVEQPLDKIAGMMNEFRLYDPAGFQQFKTAYPEIEDIPTFGQTNESSVSVEKIILLKPEVAIFGLNGHGPGARSKHIIDQLTAVGIKIVFIDFREDPINNTAKSVEIVGKVLGFEASAQRYAERYRSSIATIQQRVATLSTKDYPKVLFDLRASAKQTCCMSVAKGMFADMARIAGGTSIADGLLTGSVGQLSTEHVLSTHFDFYVATSSGSETQNTEGHYESPVLGAAVSQNRARQSLTDLIKLRQFTELDAMQAGNAYGLWHHFYNSPLNLYAIEKLATWLHPALFADLNPEHTLNELLHGFGPIQLEGTYAINLK
ncbi:iron-siderophore ABC transporter substrate-binding protein YiuA [Litoribacillus peritrichatus]|uniref:Iron-siderophore ABC transporter substrate-binding protein YiuA n=2 Tax=Litoribacillus peritrichatus TaxID=718191 RepID=A0ABP7MVL8_9GAMM